MIKAFITIKDVDTDTVIYETSQIPVSQDMEFRDGLIHNTIVFSDSRFLDGVTYKEIRAADGEIIRVKF